MRRALRDPVELILIRQRSTNRKSLARGNATFQKRLAYRGPRRENAVQTDPAGPELPVRTFALAAVPVGPVRVVAGEHAVVVGATAGTAHASGP